MKLKRAPTQDDAQKLASSKERHKKIAERISSGMRIAKAERVKATDDVVISKEDKKDGTE